MSEVRAGSSRLELKPCPFCGGKARYVDKWGIWTNSDSVICIECGAVICRDAEADAIAAWNRRADA